MQTMPVAGCRALQYRPSVALAAVSEGGLAQVDLGNSPLQRSASIVRGSPVDRLSSFLAAAPLDGDG